MGGAPVRLKADTQLSIPASLLPSSAHNRGGMATLLEVNDGHQKVKQIFILFQCILSMPAFYP